MTKKILLELLDKRNYKELKEHLVDCNPVDLAEVLGS